MSLNARKSIFEFFARSDTNQAKQPQTMDSGLEVDVLYSLASKIELLISLC